MSRNRSTPDSTREILVLLGAATCFAGVVAALSGTPPDLPPLLLGFGLGMTIGAGFARD